jgi:DNA end-binding protein Ku
MAPRATWKGVLKIALVTIPIKVFPATESAGGLSFNQLHGECKTRISQKRWCATCDREVANSEIVKGFEFEPGRYVILEPAELEAIQPPSTRIIDLVQFAEASALDPLYVDRSYYLAPDGPLAGQAFAVMRAAMIGKVGIGKLAIYGREYLVAVRPQAAVVFLHTLHHAAEIRSTEDLVLHAEDDLAPAPTAQIRLAQLVIDALRRPLDLAAFTDEYQADLRRLIDAKVAGDEIVVPPLATVPALPLLEALTQSLAAVSAVKRPPAKAGLPAKRKRAS